MSAGDTAEVGAPDPMLDDLLVVDLSRALAGPHAAMTLGDLGARVVKVEQPGTGDESRGWASFVGADRTSTYYLSCNRNKESVVADLKSEEGRALVWALVRRADVVIENFRPGVMDRHGFSPARMRAENARLVVCSISGFGPDGPESGRAGYDQVLQGEAGLMSVTGPSADAATKVGVPIADVVAGMNAVIGILAALHRRERSGAGEVVDVSLLSSVVGVHAFQGTRATVAGETPTALGNHHPAIAPYGLFRAADGDIQICVGSDSAWRAFASLVAIEPDDRRYASNELRVRNRERLTELIDRALSVDTVDTWLGRLEQIGIPAGRLRTIKDVYQWEQVRSQGLLLTVNHPTLGAVELPGSPIRFGRSRRSGARVQHTAPPLLGQHDETVRRWLHLAAPANGVSNFFPSSPRSG